MSIKVMSYVWEHSQHGGSDLLTLLAIADHADDKGTAFPSIRRLGEKTRMSQRNVQYVLKKLEESGELSIKKNRGFRRTNLYQIHMKTPGQLESANFAPCNGLQGAMGCRVKPIAPSPSAEGEAHFTQTVSIKKDLKTPPPETSFLLAPPQGTNNTKSRRLRLSMPGEEENQERLRASIVDAQLVAWQRQRYPGVDLAEQWEFFVSACLSQGRTYRNFRHGFMLSFSWVNAPASRLRDHPRERKSDEARQREMADWVKAKEEEERDDPDRVV